MGKSNNSVTWVDGYIFRKDRERLHGHPGFVIWFTGIPSSGKSTIAHLVEKGLYRKGCSTYVFDGDNIRHGLCCDLGFSEEDRRENIRRVGEVVRLFVDAGIIVLTAFISPFRVDRQKVRSLFNHGEFIEIYIKCPLEVCTSRDTKGIYERAKKGDIKDFTGISSPYEEPEDPEIILYTDRENPIDASKKVLEYVDKLMALKGDF